MSGFCSLLVSEAGGKKMNGRLESSCEFRLSSCDKEPTTKILRIRKSSHTEEEINIHFSSLNIVFLKV